MNQRLDTLTEELNQKQHVYDEQNNRHNQLNAQLEQRQADRQRLEENIQNVNDRWTSKQIWITSAARNLTQLNLDVDNIKIASRNINGEQVQRRLNLSEQNRNENNNQRQRQQQQQQRRS